MSRQFVSFGKFKAAGSMGLIIFLVGIGLAFFKPNETMGAVGLAMALVVFSFWVVAMAMTLDRKSRRRQ